jgi:hypothetical protein
MEFALRPSEDELGYPRIAAVIGRTPWTDTDGTTYIADKNLVGGTLNIGKGINGWEQRLEIETVVLIGGTQRRVVAHETIVDRGTFEFNVIEGMNDIYLYSTVTPGFRLHVYFPHPGRLLVPQIIGSSGLINHVYVIR